MSYYPYYYPYYYYPSYSRYAESHLDIIIPPTILIATRVLFAGQELKLTSPNQD